MRFPARCYVCLPAFDHQWFSVWKGGIADCSRGSLAWFDILLTSLSEGMGLNITIKHKLLSSIYQY